MVMNLILMTASSIGQLYFHITIFAVSFLALVLPQSIKDADAAAR